jgi:hypothetical protein
MQRMMHESSNCRDGGKKQMIKCVGICGKGKDPQKSIQQRSKYISNTVNEKCFTSLIPYHGY